VLSVVTGQPPLSPKLAELTADRIETEIAAGGWQAGVLLGSQQTLMERHGVGRPVMREVLRLLELRGVAETRRGSKGGVFIKSSASSVVSSSLATCLRFSGVTVKGVAEVRAVLEEVAIRLAVERINPAARLRVRRMVAEVEIAERDRLEVLNRIQAIFEALAEVTGNPALTTFLTTIYQTGLELSHYDLVQPVAFENDMRAWLANTRNLVEAVIVGDISFALRRLTESELAQAKVAQEGARMERAVIRGRRRTAVRGVKRNRASYLAHEIDREIRARGWPVGQYLGSEPELTKRHGVSRTILRQAVRILESHAVVSMRRGRSGGLFVTSPSASRAISLTISHLVSTKIERGHVLEVRQTLELLAVELATQRVTAEDITNLRQLANSMPASSAADFNARLADFHVRIAQLSRNSGLEIFVRVLLGLAVALRPVGGPGEAAKPVMAGLLQLVDAIESRDWPLARRTLIIHLQELERVTP
jgi:DNA-binding FadR family transcriptional regulator